MILLLFLVLCTFTYITTAFQALLFGGTRVSLISKHLRSVHNRKSNVLSMAVYTSEQGVPATLTEERDACGVGFIANLKDRPSHHILKQALDACTCMEHRGATSADNISGDGAGVMTGIPYKLFSEFDMSKLNADGSSAVGVGMVFLPRAENEEDLKEAMKAIEGLTISDDLDFLGWRDVPVDPSYLGELSKEFVPTIKQFVVSAKNVADTPSFADDAVFTDHLYRLRRKMQGNFRKFGREGAYVCSLSSKTLVYKGMLRSCDLGAFYTDLQDPNYESSFAIYHRRFSTNTVPKWYLAQPMRMLAHNGEINTLLGNVNWVKSKEEGRGRSEATFDYKAPLVDLGRSDSANLDSVFENIVRYDRSPEEALMMLVPEAYASQPKLDLAPAVKDFYTYYESLQEAWDGPALLVFSDGDVVGATLDRNGLRPARYMVTKDPSDDDSECVHVMSEVGVTKILPQFDESGTGNHVLVDAGRLGPGEMLAVDLKKGTFTTNDEIKKKVAMKRPYGQWISDSIFDLERKTFDDEVHRFKDLYNGAEPTKEVIDSGFIGSADGEAGEPTTPAVSPEGVDPEDMIRMQTAFGWGSEDVEVQITAMAANGVEATSSMGDDAPLAALSSMPHTLYDYFKQRFAQVTNPPIDPLREGAVMSLSVFLGRRGELLSNTGQPDRRIKAKSPVLNKEEMDVISNIDGIKLETISTQYKLTNALSQGGLEAALEELCQSAMKAAKDGVAIINLSDMGIGTDDTMTYIPPLMATAAVHHRLIEEGLRTGCSIVVSTGQAWSTHHMATLVGYGATAIYPYAAYDSVINWHAQKRNQLAMQRGGLARMTASQALENYRKALDKGLMKILSKMGISLITSYHGAQIFEALGLSDNVLMKTFKGTPCRVSGMTYDDIAAENAEFHRKAFGDKPFENIIAKIEGAPETKASGKKLFNYGFLNFLKSGEFHHNNQPLVKTLHAAIRDEDRDLYKLYEDTVTSRPPTTLRDVLQFDSPRKPIALDRVESVESIMKRFCTGGMSLGALSREAHETLGIAMNRIGGKSNSGEGGEDSARRAPIEDVNADGVSNSFPHLKGLKKGDLASSRIKQIASGRFGVTPAYLMSGDQLEIKMAQGAKPGEGGQLPGAKIDSYIAGLRSSKPGVTLISPPPHHDIYSIEDLAQLIYDLHQINPKAGVSVKLVSEVGIGTVASGVTKAGADVIQISGHDGGTGASPVSSIKHAGSPWELGLAEAHSTLQQNGLRQNVLLRVDGGLKSGWDVVMAAAMGAEEYGFGTIAMIAEGCIMARICHTNKCPVGVTTQKEELRKRFPGTPQDVVTYFTYVAEEVRHILAQLGYESLEEMIGVQGLLAPRKNMNNLKCSEGLDASFVLNAMNCDYEKGENLCPTDVDREWLDHGDYYSNGYTFDDKILEDVDVQSVIASDNGKITKKYHIINTDRTAFARVSGQIAKKYGDKKFRGELNFELTGGAGQSFCAFLGQGMNVKLNGYANDYVCKGMNGGQVVVSPPKENDDARKASGRSGTAAAHSVVGNTVLYGATGGEMLVRGRAGERFGVRNSGAVALVEGLGDHGCEYMTGGVIVSLGSTGRNLAAGMTGGLAFILDDEAWLDSTPAATNKVPLEKLLNGDSAQIYTMDASYVNAKAYLKDLLERHVTATGSVRASFVLSNLDEAMSKFKLLMPASETSNPLVLVGEHAKTAAVV